MAREIKIVKNLDTNEFGVRNIPDAVSKNEMVVAARWQEDGIVRSFASLHEGSERFLRDQTDGVPDTMNSSMKDFRTFIEREWGGETADIAIVNWT